MIADGGGLAAAALHPIEGSEEIARYLADLAGRALNLTIWPVPLARPSEPISDGSHQIGRARA